MKLIDVSTPKHPNTFATVDDDDFGRINQWRWRARQGKRNKVIYAVRREYVAGKRISILMHREILAGNHGRINDHKDGNGLNNQKQNLRPATASQNCFNSIRTRSDKKTSKYRGVSRDRLHGWRARIWINGVRIHIGTFRTEDSAFLAYLDAAEKMYGEFVPKEIIDARAELARLKALSDSQAIALDLMEAGKL